MQDFAKGLEKSEKDSTFIQGQAKKKEMGKFKYTESRNPFFLFKKNVAQKPIVGGIEISLPNGNDSEGSLG